MYLLVFWEYGQCKSKKHKWQIFTKRNPKHPAKNTPNQRTTQKKLKHVGNRKTNKGRQNTEHTEKKQTFAGTTIFKGCNLRSWSCTRGFIAHGYYLNVWTCSFKNKAYTSSGCICICTRIRCLWSWILYTFLKKQTCRVQTKSMLGLIWEVNWICSQCSYS